MTTTLPRPLARSAGRCAPQAEVDERLARHAALVRKWGRVHNLVGRNDLPRLEQLHVQDSLALLPWCAGRLADVGSGAGFPGIPLAVARPEMRVTLIERGAFKGRFLRQVAIELGLGNVEVRICDAQVLEEGAFDTVTARAVAPPLVAWPLVGRLLAPGGRALFQLRQAPDPADFAGGEVVETARCGRGHVAVVRHVARHA